MVIKGKALAPAEKRDLEGACRFYDLFFFRLENVAQKVARSMVAILWANMTTLRKIYTNISTTILPANLKKLSFSLFCVYEKTEIRIWKLFVAKGFLKPDDFIPSLLSWF